MRWLLIALGLVVGGTLVFFAAMYGASELGGEVVVLQRKSADGSASRVRIWIVDDGDMAWIEHGAPDSDWIAMLADNPIVTLERKGETRQYRAFADPQAHAKYHELRRDKYGFADAFVELLVPGGDECPRIAGTAGDAMIASARAITRTAAGSGKVAICSQE